MALTGLATLLGLALVDARLQSVVDEIAQREHAEAIVVLEAATGRVLARAGHVERAYPPGSTFKIVDVIAAAAARPEALAGTVRCAGRARQSERDVRCWKPGGHGELDLEGAIPESCNIYFGAVGERVGTAALIAAARTLGVGVGAGRLPDESAPAALVADGEGVLVTALQLAGLLRAVATGARPDGRPIARADLLERLRIGLRAAVERGTAAAAASSVPVAGKTGSAGLGAGMIGWFAGYAPAGDPSVIVVIARRGAMGREVARSAGPIFEAFFHGAQAGSGPPPATATGRR